MSACRLALCMILLGGLAILQGGCDGPASPPVSAVTLLQQGGPPEELNDLLSHLLLQQGVPLRLQTDYARDKLLSRLIRDELHNLVGISLEKVENSVGVPFMEIQGDILGSLSATPIGSMPLCYTPLGHEEFRDLNNSGKSLQELRSIPYQDLEATRAQLTIFPAGAQLGAAETSSVYLISDILKRPGPICSRAVVVGYVSGRLHHYYEIWLVGQELELQSPRP